MRSPVRSAASSLGPDAELWFIDGNHEDFPQLARLAPARVQRVVDAVQPSPIMHGHLHRAYQRSCDFGYGPVQVAGLDADGRLRNFAVLDVADMRWELREGWFGRASSRLGDVMQ